jgi:type IV pilus assembly protein PilW
VRRSRGFSMVELLVAITLGLIVLAGLLGLFAGTRTANRSTMGLSNLTEGGRFALDFISSSARGAGFYSCSNASRQLSILNAGATPLPFSFANPVSGFEAAVTNPGNAVLLPARPVVGDAVVADWTGGLDAALAGLPVKGSDVLVLRSSLPRTGAVPALPVYVTAIVNGANSFSVNTPGNLANGQLAVIADCVNAVTFQVTAFNGISVTHAAGGGPPGNSQSALPIQFSVGAEVMPVTTTVYYIGVGADGDGALFQMDLNGTGVFTTRELVSDIENMQVLYGFDINGNQTSYQYMTANQVTAWTQVASIKVAVLAASPPNSVTPPTVAQTFNLLGTTVTVPLDSRSRQAFDSTITIRNSVN